MDKRRNILKKNTRSFTDFVQPKQDQSLTKVDKPIENKKIGTARPGKVPLPTITFRVTQEQWERLKMLAIQDRTTLQNIAEQAFASEFKKRGLPW